MPKPTKGPRLGSGPSHERLILRTLAEQLFEHGKITTTEAKAKRRKNYNATNVDGIDIPNRGLYLHGWQICLSRLTCTLQFRKFR